MSLSELRIENLRCIARADLEFAPGLNLLSGENGAGKTSVLEAIFLLGRGRSFRTRSSERLIRHGERDLTVFGRTDDSLPRTAGVEVSRAGTRARIDGRDASALLELSQVVPVQAIDPEIHKLIDQGPERRRRWLDWLVFHVEPTFAEHWTRYQRALKQRNAALRAGAGEFAVWDPILVDHGMRMTKARIAALERLDPHTHAMFQAFNGLAVTTAFYPGWTQDEELHSAFASSYERDRQRGTTTVGPHRADVVLRHGGRSARETLSRGQQKLTGIALVLAQMKLMEVDRHVRPALLLDDPAAELDPQNLSRLFAELVKLDCQMITTSLRSDAALFRPPERVFHVEQGRVLQV